MSEHQYYEFLAMDRPLTAAEQPKSASSPPGPGSPPHVILDLTSEEEEAAAGEWVEDAEDSLSAIVGVRSELAAGDLRPLYLAWSR